MYVQPSANVSYYGGFDIGRFLYMKPSASKHHQVGSNSTTARPDSGAVPAKEPLNKSAAQ